MKGEKLKCKEGEKNRKKLIIGTRKNKEYVGAHMDTNRNR